VAILDIALVFAIFKGDILLMDLDVLDNDGNGTPTEELWAQMLR
jgi:hypothetical protein